MSLQRGLYNTKAGTHLGKSSVSATTLTGFKSYNSACGDNPLLFIKYLQTLSHLALAVSSTGNTLSSAVCLTCSLPVSCLFNLIFPGDIGATTPPGTFIICFSSMALFTNWLFKAGAVLCLSQIQPFIPWVLHHVSTEQLLCGSLVPACSLTQSSCSVDTWWRTQGINGCICDKHSTQPWGVDIVIITILWMRWRRLREVNDSAQVAWTADLALLMPPCGVFSRET